MKKEINTKTFQIGQKVKATFGNNAPRNNANNSTITGVVVAFGKLNTIIVESAEIIDAGASVAFNLGGKNRWAFHESRVEKI